MGKGIVIGIVVLVVILIVVVLINSGRIGGGDPALKITINDEADVVPDSPVDSGVVGDKIVEISSSGFSPETLEIRSGDTVTFINTEGTGHWPATDIHPSHRVYPGSSIGKCGTGEERNIFDACKELSQGERYSFTFNEVGNWRYHDHKNPGLRGMILVR